MKFYQIRNTIAGIIKDRTSATLLPEECDSLGIPGLPKSPNSSEGLGCSKREYVDARLKLMQEHDLLDLAEKVAEGVNSRDNYELLDSIYEIRDQNLPAIGDDVRRKIAGTYTFERLSGNIPSEQFMTSFGAPEGVFYFDGEPNRCAKAYRDHDEECLEVDAVKLIEITGALKWSKRRFLKMIEGTLQARCRNSWSATALKNMMMPILTQVGWTLVDDGTGGKEPVYRIVPAGRGQGVAGQAKNLIFASTGLKPELVLNDVLSYDIQIVTGAESCLVYDRPLPPNGLLWRDLVAWWAEREDIRNEAEARKSLGERLKAACHGSKGELNLFRHYFVGFGEKLGPKLPALIPQVYLHYDPATLKQLGGVARVARQRMDFLMLLPHGVRIVIEVDGKRHFANSNGLASLERYSEMVAADRDLRLAGYEIYRFGASEVWREGYEDECGELIISFFERLLRKHSIT